MTLLQNIFTVGLVCGALILMLAGSIGLLRLPDFYSRTHATSKVDTLGIMILLLGFAAYEGLSLNSAKLLVAMLFIALANPMSAHALARAALRLGLQPWTQKNKNPPHPSQD